MLQGRPFEEKDGGVAPGKERRRRQERGGQEGRAWRKRGRGGSWPHIEHLGVTLLLSIDPVCVRLHVLYECVWMRHTRFRSVPFYLHTAVLRYPGPAAKRANPQSSFSTESSPIKINTQQYLLTSTAALNIYKNEDRKWK